MLKTLCAAATAAVALYGPAALADDAVKIGVTKNSVDGPLFVAVPLEK
jgi:ABC-type sugar transport system substrate-binding protein